MLPIQTILHPTDFSKPSDYALQVARALARDQSRPPDYLARCARHVSRRERRLWRTVGRGDPAAEILRIAQDTNSDLIVMGTHGRSGLGRLLMGSVAEQVVRKASCPVLTVKAS
jgi:nucleotide-binding universal stress UspA family protein